MSMEDKVNDEMAWDLEHNKGRHFKDVVGIIIRNGIKTEPRPAEELAQISEVLGNDAESRTVGWRNRAIAHIASLPKSDLMRLEWPGSEVVTDINQFRNERGSTAD